jgi:hypothetical protein
MYDNSIKILWPAFDAYASRADLREVNESSDSIKAGNFLTN